VRRQLADLPLKLLERPESQLWLAGFQLKRL
jgi:hypothetical protein